MATPASYHVWAVRTESNLSSLLPANQVWHASRAVEDEGDRKKLNQLSDGRTDSGLWLGITHGPCWLQCSLPSVSLISEIVVHYYHADGRSVKGVDVQISNSVDANAVDTEWQTVHSAALEKGLPGGNVYKLDPLRVARHIRITQHGNSVNGSSHWVNIQAIGVPV
jgi:hypothetical protein